MTVFCVICLTGFTYSTLCYSVSFITEGCSRGLDGASEGQEGRGTGILTCDDGLKCIVRTLGIRKAKVSRA